MPKISHRDQNIIKLANLRDKLLWLMNPKVLKSLASILEGLGGDKNNYVHQFRVWAQKNGPDCKYSAMAKQFFLEEQADEIAKGICDIYHSWAKFYNKEN